MNRPRIGARLETIAGLVKYETVADVASDHALLPVFLAQTGKIRSAVASDISSACCEKAAAYVEAHGLSGVIDVRAGDGTAPVDQRYETLVISGVGGMLIIDILKADLNKARGFKQLILSPHRDARALRGFLTAGGFAIRGEKALYEGGRYYVILDCAAANAGEAAPAYSEEELLFGASLLAGNDGAARLYIEGELLRAEKAARSSGGKSASAAELKRLCEKALMKYYGGIGYDGV